MFRIYHQTAMTVDATRSAETLVTACKTTEHRNQKYQDRHNLAAFQLAVMQPSLLTANFM
jgi:hypothetical protein